MLVKSKERKEVFFRDIEVGQVFKDENNDIFMKVHLEDDDIYCPVCNADICINDEKGCTGAVELGSGLVYDFEGHSTVEIVQGYFIEE